MKVNLEVNIKPFNVPNFVVIEKKAGTRQEGFKESPAIPLNELGEDVIWKLCDEFCNEVYKKAGVKTPPTCA